MLQELIEFCGENTDSVWMSRGEQVEEVRRSGFYVKS